MTSLTFQQRTTLQRFMDLLPTQVSYDVARPRRGVVIDFEANYSESGNEAVNLYRHFLLLKDDLRYHVEYNGQLPTDINQYVRQHYPKLIERVQTTYLHDGIPDWTKIQSIETAGIHVTYQQGQLRFHFGQQVLAI